MSKTIKEQIEMGQRWAAKHGAPPLVAHYVTEEEYAALASETTRGVPPHIAMTRKLVLAGVSIRSIEVVTE